MTITTSAFTKQTKAHFYYSQLQNKIQNKTAVIGVIGLGYVGLPTAISKAKQGYYTFGFDLDREKVFNINSGISHIEDIPNNEILENRHKMSATSDFTLLKNTDVIKICVPTPVDETKYPDLSYVKKATIDILNNITEGTMIILESTTYPSTTEEIIIEGLKRESFTVGEDVFVAYSPERIDPSNELYTIENTPRIVGGYTELCTELSMELLGEGAVPVSSIRVAEMAKVYENTFRFINIALANEIDMICNQMKLDVWEVIDASATKPYGFMPFYPTAKVGGHCIPVDPHYLSFQSKKFNSTMKLVNIAEEINSGMIDYTITRIGEILNHYEKTIKGSSIMILGATYKKNVRDTRESSIVPIYEKLSRLGANIEVIDPYITSIETSNKNVQTKDIDDYRADFFDLTVILADHDVFDMGYIAKESNIIFDTKNSLKNMDVRGDYYKL